MLFACNSMTSLAQRPTVLDGAYIPTESDDVKKFMPYPPLREADVMYKRRVWQEIDLRQKFNHPFYFPIDPIFDRKNLFDILMHNIEVEPRITAYSAGPLGDDDEFLVEMDPRSKEWRNAVGKMDYVDRTNELGEKTGEVDSVYTRVSSKDVTKYRIKEDWIWDRARSERYVRIIGIAPMQEVKDETGESIGFKPLFWVHYNSIRYILAEEEVYNTFNDAQRRTFDDLFQKRYFSSYIVKEDNAFNRSIAGYVRGLDALAESERIQQELFNLEHDMWHY